MNTEYLHLYLGLTRAELKRRLESGVLDSQAIKSQIEDYCTETKLNALIDQWLSDHQSEQMQNDEIEIQIEIMTDKASDLQ